MTLRGARRAVRRRPPRRDARRDQGVRRHADPPARLLAAVRAVARRARRKPSFNASDPDAYPAGNWARLDGADRRRPGARDQRDAHAHRPGAQVGDQEQEELSSTGRARSCSASSSPRSRAATATQVAMWSVWNEPNQPQFLMPQYRKKQAVLADALPRPLPRRLQRRSAASPANRRDKILIGETSPRGNVHIVHPLRFLRGIACLNDSYKKTRSCSRLPADGYAHHAYTTRLGPRFVPADKNDVTIGVISRLVTALDRAGKRGRPAEAPEDLPDRVRHPVRARTRSPASRSSASRRTTRSPSTSRT